MAGKEYRLVVTHSARKDLLNLPPKISEQVERAIDRLLARLQEGHRPRDMKSASGGRLHTYRLDSGPPEADSPWTKPQPSLPSSGSNTANTPTVRRRRIAQLCFHKEHSYSRYSGSQGFLPMHFDSRKRILGVLDEYSVTEVLDEYNNLTFLRGGV